MFARIGVMRALDRHVERVFNPDRKDHHWGPEAGKGSMNRLWPRPPPLRGPGLTPGLRLHVIAQQTEARCHRAMARECEPSHRGRRFCAAVYAVNPSLEEIKNMPEGPDTYESMTALYADPKNVEGITYGKRWLRHKWTQIVGEQVPITLKHKR